MSLKGNLKEFSIAEIFQFLSITHKTGVLKIESEGQGRIYFKNGEGSFATSSRYHKPIGQRLVEANLMSKEDLAKALDAQKAKGPNQRLGRILVEMGLIQKEALESFIKEQIWDAFLDILSWQGGEFEFAEGVMPTEEDIGITFEAWNKMITGIPSFESVIKSEHWAKIKEAIPSFDIVFALNQGRATDVAGINLAPEEWGLVCMIDGKKTVEELIKEYGRDHFQTGYTLYKLVRAGLIAQVGKEMGSKPAEPARIAAPNRETPARIDQERPRSEPQPADKPVSQQAPQERRQAVAVQVGDRSKPVARLGAEEAKAVAHAAGPNAASRTIAGSNGGSKTGTAVRDEARGPVAAGRERPAESKPSGQPDNKSSDEPIEIKSLGNLEVWVGKEKRFADLFIIKKGDRASNVLHYPDGRYQFVHDRFSPEEKKEILERIALVKK